MLDKPYLEKIAIKQQTTYANVVREYVQNLFLRSFYTKIDSENFLFKGGTALRIVFNSPRFSEDLDFTGFSDGKVYEKVLEEVIYDLVSEGMVIDIEESKETSGGYLANILINLKDESVLIKNQISFRDQATKLSENMLVTNDLVPTYNVHLLNRSILLKEKITALIQRSKPRDFFDLHFILTNEKLRTELNLNSGDREKIIDKIKLQSKKLLEIELKRFLPKSFLGIIKNLPETLTKDLMRN